jgi:hypothetical protein
MIEPIPTNLNDRVLGLRINGPIEKADLDLIAIAFEQKLQRYPRLRIYAEVQEVGSISPAALLENLALLLGHFHDVERQAIVADADWSALLAKAGDLLPGIEVRQFAWADKNKAIAWINGV